ncbi:uncharacterized protein LOC144168437 [Haemaphysalis longicornis]
MPAFLLNRPYNAFAFKLHRLFSDFTNGGPYVSEKDRSGARAGNLPSSTGTAMHRLSNGQIPSILSIRQLTVDPERLKDGSGRSAPPSRSVPDQQQRLASEVGSPASKVPLRPLNEAITESSPLRASIESEMPATSTKPRPYVLFVVLAVLGQGILLRLGFLLSALLRPGPWVKTKEIPTRICGGIWVQGLLDARGSAAVRHEV